LFFVLGFDKIYLDLVGSRHIRLWRSRRPCSCFSLCGSRMRDI